MPVISPKKKAVSFSIIMEVLQKLLTNSRHFDIFDIYANIGGTIIGAVLFMLFQKFFPRSLSEMRA
jgi:glycopeptide antibiotics resistance protein